MKKPLLPFLILSSSFLIPHQGLAQALSVSIADSTINCSPSPTGRLIASATGGTSPYSYAWYDSGWGLLGAGITHFPMAYGTYRVIVTDDNSDADTATIAISANLFDASVTPIEIGPGYHATCDSPDGQVELSVSGGEGPFCVRARWHLWEMWGEEMELPSPYLIDTCVGSVPATLGGLYREGYSVTVTSHGGEGCQKAYDIQLRASPDPLLRITGELYPNGHYVSCDTCADGRFTLSFQGANGSVEYVWGVPNNPAIVPDILAGRATLSLPFYWREGHNPTSFDDFDILASGTEAATIEELEAEQWYFAIAMDEAGCMDHKPLFIERPRPPAGAWLTKGQEADSAAVLGTANAMPLRLMANDTVRLTIAPDGTVGIGTDTVPDGYLMAVNGRMIAEEVEVRLHADWPDYVFAPGYQLPPLDSVQQHIQQHGHLPGFPSAKAMQQRGSIASGQMVTALVQKVEELTLYVIQLQQQVRALQQQQAHTEVKVRGMGNALNNAGGNGNPHGGNEE